MHLRLTALLSLLAVLGGGAFAQEEIRPRQTLYTDRTDDAVEGALRWLAERQNRNGEAKGSWNAVLGFKINDGYRADPARQPAGGLPHLGVTALAGMAFLAGGHLPGEGPYGDVVEDALEFVLSSVHDDGYITRNGSRMYSHAFSLLFLAEVYGMTGNPILRDRLDRAVEFTYKSQNGLGGWRYAPGAQDCDMSITVCQVVALREASNIGVKVPKENIDKALKYVLDSAVTRQGERGAFLYQHKDVPFNRNSFALTAAGLTTIYQAGLYSDGDVYRFCMQHDIARVPRISDCLSYLQRTYDAVLQEYDDHYFYFYGNYYAAQAMYTRGGETWREWYAMVRDHLLERAYTTKGPRGTETSWRARHVGDAFSTSVAAIILQVPKHYLPIFQR
ncbi:MAG TPA: prenyltransferase/squalene oxidase repeat-containing protein [Planctomycetota bacterium]|nr:prenyltransferase/squalene oxidase repeat-containing protein [Planctomycetota bacterium]